MAAYRRSAPASAASLAIGFVRVVSIIKPGPSLLATLRPLIALLAAVSRRLPRHG